MTTPGRAARSVCLLSILFVLPRPAAGQVIDARLVPPGAFRIAFTPEYQVWDHVFAADGTVRPLGTYFSADSAGSNLFPTLAGAEAAVRAITGNQNYRLSLGSVTTTVDADVRRFPFDLSLGIARRLTLTANVPIVVTRVKTTLAADTATAHAGWNQAAFESGNAAGRAQITTLLAELDRAANDLESRIAGGSYGCPGSGMCAAAQDLLVRTRGLRSNLIALSGVLTTGPLPPAAPMAGSPEGMEILNAIAQISGELPTYGVAGISATMPLPTSALSGTDVRGIISSPSFGYTALLPAYSKRASFGDVEVGARLGLVQASKLRVTVTGTARLPTGNRDFADNLVDIGSGDRQLDLVAGIELAIEPGPVSLTAGGTYTWQRPGPIVRRVTAPDQPIAPADVTAEVNRKPGDMLWLSAYPALHLAEGFRVHGSFSYFRKVADRYTPAATTPATISPSVLDQLTAMESLSVGGGIAYRAIGGRNNLPIESGLSYLTTISGSGGFTPKATVLSLYLRVYYKIWGGAASAGGSQ